MSTTTERPISFTGGVDIGARSVKVALLSHQGPKSTVLANAAIQIPGSGRARDAIREGWGRVLAEASLSTRDVDYIASTGAPARSVDRVGHFYGHASQARGARLLFPDATAGAGRRNERDPWRRAERVACEAPRLDQRRCTETGPVPHARSPSRGAPRSALGALRRCSASRSTWRPGRQCSFGRWRPRGKSSSPEAWLGRRVCSWPLERAARLGEPPLAPDIAGGRLCRGLWGGDPGGASVRTDRAIVGARFHRATGVGTGRPQGPLAELTRRAVCFSRRTGRWRCRRRGSRPR